MAVTLPGNELRIYQTGQWQTPIQVWPGAVSHPAFTSDGKTLAVSLDPTSISLIDLENARIQCRLEHPGGETPRKLAFSNDGSSLFFNSTEANCLFEWRIAECFDQLRAHGF